MQAAVASSLQVYIDSKIPKAFSHSELLYATDFSEDRVRSRSSQALSPLHTGDDAVERDGAGSQ